MALQFHSLKVSSIRYDTASAVELGFRIPDSKKADFLFDPGQYLTIALTIDDKKVRRAYSICSAVHEPSIRILIKRVNNGLVSNYLNDNILIGDTIEVLPPNGHFKLALGEKEKLRYYFFGAGSGITPLISMISSVLEKEQDIQCHLLYGSTDEDNIIFREKIDRLQLVYNRNFIFKQILSRPKKVKSSGLLSFMRSTTVSWKGTIGRINKASIESFIKNDDSNSSKIEGYFICGPGAMIENTYEALLDLGIDKKLILREYFSTPLMKKEAVLVDIKKEKITSQVKIILEGKEINIEVKEDTNIVQALLDKDIEPPYSCLSGTCSTCVAKLEKGSVHMDVSIGLEDDEKEKGFILTCQSHPLTEELVVNYDTVKHDT